MCLHSYLPQVHQQQIFSLLSNQHPHPQTHLPTKDKGGDEAEGDPADEVDWWSTWAKYKEGCVVEVQGATVETGFEVSHLRNGYVVMEI